MTKTVHGHVSITRIDGPRDLQAACVQKPFLKLQFRDGTVIQITSDLAEMIGTAGTAQRLRHEDMIRRAHS